METYKDNERGKKETFDENSKSKTEFTGSAKCEYVSNSQNYISNLSTSCSQSLIKKIIEENIDFLSFEDIKGPAMTIIETGVFDALMSISTDGIKEEWYHLIGLIVSCNSELSLLSIQHFLVNKIIDSHDLLTQEYSELAANALCTIIKSSPLCCALIIASPLIQIINESINDLLESSGNEPILLSFQRIIEAILENARIAPLLLIEEKRKGPFLRSEEISEFFEGFSNDGEFFSTESIVKYQEKGLVLWPNEESPIFSIVIDVLRYMKDRNSPIFSTAIKNLTLIIDSESIYFSDILENENLILMLSDLEQLLSLDKETRKIVVKFLGLLFYHVSKKTDRSVGNSVSAFLVHCICENEDDNSLFGSATSALINVLVNCDELDFESLFTEDFFDKIRTLVFEGDFVSKRNALTIITRLASEFDSSLIDEDIMDVIISFLDPESVNFDIADLLLSDLYIIFKYKDDEESAQVKDLFFAADGEDILDDLMELSHPPKYAIELQNEIVQNNVEIVLNLD